MATYGQTVTRILDDLSRPEDELGDIARREILSAIQFYSSERLGFNERVLTFTITATNQYTFTSIMDTNSLTGGSIWKIDHLRVLYSSRWVEVCEAPFIDVYNLNNNNTTANLPDLWAIFNRTLRLYPNLSSDASLSAEIAAHVKFPELSAASDENEWLTDGEELIRSRACRLICQRKLDDFEKAQQFTQLEAEALRTLLADASMLQSTGILSSNW